MGRTDRTYKRRWRNLLLNVRYQLSFTTLLVGVTAVLMLALGLWLKDKAYIATNVSATRVIALECPEMPDLVQAALYPMPDAASQNDPIPDEVVDAGAGERPAPRVIIEESSIEEVTPAINAETMTGPTLANIVCRLNQSYKIQPLWARYRLFLYLLFGVTFVLVIGLAFYGIKMTHKVAGPLHKVGLYLDKLAAGTYDTVYNLRRGDQLGAFYEHFKGAHAGLSEMQAEDIEVLESAIEALSAVPKATIDASPELKAAIAELEALLESKREGYKVTPRGGDA